MKHKRHEVDVAGAEFLQNQLLNGRSGRNSPKSTITGILARVRLHRLRDMILTEYEHDLLLAPGT